MRRVKQSTKELIRVGKEIGFNINKVKTKYLILSRHHTARKLVIEGFSFERVGRTFQILWSMNE